MKIKNIKNRPVLIEYRDIAIALRPNGVLDIGKNFSKSIKRALDNKEVLVLKEKKLEKKKPEKKKPEKKKPKKNMKKKVDEKVEKKVEKKVDEKVEKKVSDTKKDLEKPKSGLKTIKDLREEEKV